MFVQQFRTLIYLIVLVTSVFFCRWMLDRNYSNYNECTLPKHPINGAWQISGGAKLLPGDRVKNGNVLSVSCNSQHRLTGSARITCNNGKWSSKIGSCLELCPPLVEKSSISFTCSTNGRNSDCSKATNGTVATLKCAPFYENQELTRNPFRVCKNGRWNDDILPCTPICGVKPEPSENGSTKPNYPWNVIIYDTQNNEKRVKCAGTLISENAILTAANCLTYGAVVNGSFNVLVSPFRNFTLAAGKSYGGYEDSRDPEAQYSEVKDIFVPANFKAISGKFDADVAVIIAATNFNMSRRIQPACVDWSNKYNKEYEYPKISGRIAGPIVPVRSPNFTQIIDFNIPLMSQPECFRILTQSYEDPFLNRSIPYHFIYSIRDKYCSQYNNSEGFTDCAVDVGVGLITENSYNKKYYVTGIFSGGTINPKSTWFQCNKGAWMLFTKTYDYVEFIIDKVNLYVPINREQYQASCGIKSIQPQTLIVNGKTVEKGDYPWQVALYRTINSTLTLICGGSLINPRLILTAAHCVTDQNGVKRLEDNYMVAVGKFYRNYDDTRDTNAQYSKVRKIILPDEFKGSVQNYVGDIAILITETAFELSREVQPICVDWEAKYESQFLKPNISGFVAGWGFTQEAQAPSEELKDLQVPYIEPEECSNALPSDFEIYLTTDKLCSGFLDKGKSVCNGDSGGGLVFLNKNDNRYYLAGIVSLSPQRPTAGCDSSQYALYTRVSKYIKHFILERVRLYWD